MEEKIYERYEAISKVLSKEYSLDNYKSILNKLKDEKSKLMFFYRVMFDNTNNPMYALLLEKMMYYDTTFYSENDRVMYDYLNFLLRNNNYNKKIFFIGFPFSVQENNFNMWAYLCLINHKIGCLNVCCIFDDNYNYRFNAWEKNIEVKSLKDLYNINISNDMIFVVNDTKYIDLIDYIQSKVSDENIFVFESLMAISRGKQYLDEDFIKFSDEEIFFDGGASNLETTTDFIDVVDGKYKKIYVAEPYKKDYEECLRIIKDRNIYNVQIENVGLWSSNKVLNFDACGFGSSNICEDGKNRINCRTIDSILNDQEVSIIKMDIEGSEYDALIGATNSIREYHPTLMVCIYHKPNDVFKLTKIVLDIRDDYDLYIRHYSYTRNETVLYFVPANKLLHI